MKLSLTIFTILVVLASSTAPAANAQGDTVLKVFLLAGQSNMEGQGVVEMDHPQYYNSGKGNLVWSMEHSPSASKMKHLKDGQGRWTVRDDVRISFKNKKGLRVDGLSIGFTGYGGRSHIGPELQFGHVMGDYFEEQVLLIKTAWGGKSLCKDFRPPSAGQTVGPFYQQMIEEVRDALSALGDQKYEIAGFVWQQGWNDMVDNEALAEYESNLIHLAADIRREFHLPKLPIVIGELGNGGPQAGDNMMKIRAAQKSAADRIDHAIFVPTTAFARPAAMSPNVGHGHHWFGNAESYFLIGDALGKGMIELLENESTQLTESLRE